jgi:hypothetical protein
MPSQAGAWEGGKNKILKIQIKYLKISDFWMLHELDNGKFILDFIFDL